jgi:1-acyl-sn-glycerol-3-phosphate acyltransferase
MILYRILRPLCWAVYQVLFRPRVYGREHLPRTGGFIVCMNHVSGFDPPLVSVLVPRPVVHLTKAELFRYPVLGSVLRALGAIPVRRGEVDGRALRLAVQCLKAGHPMSVFPEGTRRAEARGKPRSGAAFLALHAGVPIVPGAICTPYRPGRRLVVRFGPPLRWDPAVPAKGNHQRLEWMSARIMEEIEALRRAPLGVRAPAGFDTRAT